MSSYLTQPKFLFGYGPDYLPFSSKNFSLLYDATCQYKSGYAAAYNPNAIFPLIPHDMDPFFMVDYIHLCGQQLTDPTHDAEVLARMLLSTRREAFFLHMVWRLYKPWTKVTMN